MLYRFADVESHVCNERSSYAAGLDFPSWSVWTMVFDVLVQQQLTVMQAGTTFLVCVPSRTSGWYPIPHPCSNTPF